MSSASVTVTINGKDYPMACAPGEEKKVEALGARIDEVARQVASASGAIGESRLLVMASLILMDQMQELENNSKERVSSASPQTEASAEPLAPSVDEDKLVSIIDNLAERLEKLASQGTSA